jgi:Glycosyl hydrolase family 3 N terminal domain
MGFVRALCCWALLLTSTQGNVPANTRLGIPAINMNDGPQGFRGIPGTSTCWPSGLTMAATWNTTAMLAWGRGMGQEFVAKGVGWWQVVIVGWFAVFRSASSDCREVLVYVPRI